MFNAKTFRYPEGSGRVTTGEPVSLPNMPQSLVDTLRSEMLSGFPFEVKVRSKVGVYYYSDVLVLTNFNDQSVYANVALQSKCVGRSDDPVTRRYLGDWSDGKLSFEIPRRKFTALLL